MKHIRFRILLIVLSLLLGTSAAFGMDPQNNNGVNSQFYSIADNAESIINAVQDEGVKEKLTDLLSIRYLEVVVQDGKANPSLLAEDEAINNLKSLSKKSEQQLENEIKAAIKDTINLVKTKPNVVLLPSSYEVLEKYNFSDELEEIKSMKKEARASISGSSDKASSIQRTPNMSWEKSGTGYLGTPLVGTTAYYTITIQWWTNSSNQIYFYDDYHGGSSNQIYYEYISHSIVSEGITPGYNGQRASVVGKAKYKKAGITWNVYDYIYVEVWFYNDGGFDSTFWTD